MIVFSQTCKQGLTMLYNIETWLAGPTPTSTGRRASSLTRRATGASPPAPATRLDLSIKLCEVFTKFGEGPGLGVFNKKNILAGCMDIYNGCTSWIEDECPDTISEFYFSIPFLQLLCVMISHWLTVLKHKILSQILIKNS